MTNSITSPKGDITSLSDLRHDSKNANRGTERGLEMIRASLERLGAGRSIVLDKHGRIVAGNQTVRAAGLAGMDDVIVIRTDGRQIVAVQRTDIDLDSAEGRELALVDNRASEVGLEWSLDVLDELQSEGLDLSGLFTAEEIETLLGELDAEDQDAEDQDAEDQGSPSSLRLGSSLGEAHQGGKNGASAPAGSGFGAGAVGIISPVPGNGVDGRREASAPNAAGSGQGPTTVPPPAPFPTTQAPNERVQRPLGPQGAPPPLDPPPIHTGDFIHTGDAPPVQFKEFDESVAAGVTVHQCPACGNRWAE